MKGMDLTKIDTSNESLIFLNWRIKRKDYRGIHLSQHNRLTFFKFSALVIALNKNARILMKIPQGDEGKNFVMGDYKEYQKFINDFYEELTTLNLKKQGTPNSIKKNLFVDLARMNVIYRYDKNKNKLELHSKKAKINYIKLNESASEYEKWSISKKEKYFKDKSRELYTDYLPNLFTILNCDEINGTINENEFLFFFTWIGKEYNKKVLDELDIVSLILSYRKLNRSKKENVVEEITRWAKPSNFVGKKNNKRDFHNWKNETQQIMQNLKDSGLFTLNDRANKFELLFKISDKMPRIRSQTAKIEYFNNHNITKKIGFELDHIIPFSWSTTYEEALDIDNWKNLIYIDAGSHAIKSQQKNKHIFFGKNQNEKGIYKLYSNDGNEIILEIQKNLLFNEELYEIIFEYNRKMHETVGK